MAEGKVDWARIDGRKCHISVGPSGVWGVNSANDIYFREGTFPNPAAVGTSWTRVKGK